LKVKGAEKRALTGRAKRRSHFLIDIISTNYILSGKSFSVALDGIDPVIPF